MSAPGNCIVGLAIATTLTAFVSEAQAAVAGATVATPDFSVMFSIADVAFDGPGRVDVPLTSTHTKSGSRPRLTSVTLDLSANQTGASNGIGTRLTTSISDPTTATNN